MTIALSVSIPLLIRGHAAARLEQGLARGLALTLLAYIVVGIAIRTRGYGLPLLENLPLHLCGVTVILGAVMLWRRSYGLYEVLYFWGTGGTLVALLTPDLEESFPGLLFLLFFLGHGLAFTSVMFATIVWRFRPRHASVLVALLATAAYAAAVYPLNRLIGSNYLYLSHKPEQPSPLDYFGPWPWYLLGLVGATIAICYLVYLPFALGNLIARGPHRA